MPFRVHGLGVLSGFVPAAPPRRGMMLGQDGRWVALGPAGLVHMRVLEGPVRWDGHGRRLYALLEDALYAMDARTGDVLWERALQRPAAALSAHAAGVDVVTDGAALRFSPTGVPIWAMSTEWRATDACSSVEGVWFGGPDGVWACDGRRVRELRRGACVGLFHAETGVWAFLEDARTRLIHDDGTSMEWDFPIAPSDVVQPATHDTFWLCRDGTTPRIVDRRQQQRWTWRGSVGEHTRSVASGPFALVLSDGAWLVGPRAPDLALPAEVPDVACAGDGIFALTRGDDTQVFLVEDVP